MTFETLEQSCNPAPGRERASARLWASLRCMKHRLSSDESLVQRACAGDLAAFDSLIARHRYRLYSLALHSIGNEDAAAEVLRDVTIAAFRDLDASVNRCAPGTWLFLHGVRAVLARMHIAPGRYALDCRIASPAAPRDRAMA